MSFRSPLSQVRGLGAAGEGVAHWWWQRLTGIAMVPLGLWFAFAFLARVGAGHADVVEWLSSPWTATLVILFIACMFHHAQLGVQVVIEDYVHHEGLKIGAIILPLLGMVAYYTLAERKVIAYMHVRVGPNRVGPKGLLQPIADAVELLGQHRSRLAGDRRRQRRGGRGLVHADVRAHEGLLRKATVVPGDRAVGPDELQGGQGDGVPEAHREPLARR